MKNKLLIFMISVCMITGMFSFAFAESGDNTVVNLDKRFFSDYSTETGIGYDTFNPGEFTVNLAVSSIEWLGISEAKSGSIKIKTDADKIKLSEVIPNLNTFAVAEELAKTSMAGNTFTCRNQPVSWNGKTGQWVTAFNDPSGRIKTALDSLGESGGKYITKSVPPNRMSKGGEAVTEWFDSYMIIPSGTTLKYGQSGIRFTKSCEIDELYDPVYQKEYYASTFAENIYKIKTSIESISGDDSIELIIPEGAFLQFGGYRYTAAKEISISINGAALGSADLVAELIAAIDTANNTNVKYTDDSAYHETSNEHSDLYPYNCHDEHPRRDYYIHECDVNKVFSSGFSLLNELVGVLAQKDIKIVVASPEGDDAEGVTVNDIDPNAALCAEISVTSSVETEKVCTHSRTKIEGKIDPTFRTVGYTGDVVCADCGKLIKEGSMIPKKPSSIKLNATSLKLKVKQSSSALKVSFVAGDSIKSVSSSKTSIVKAIRSGKNKIKLTAGKKTGKAVVTIKLASGKKAKVTVTVQKGAVQCTKIKIKSGTTVKLKKGKTHAIKVQRSPITCVQKIKYESSNKKVATVTSKGKVKAKKKGSATITVKCGKKTKKIKIKVK